MKETIAGIDKIAAGDRDSWSIKSIAKSSQVHVLSHEIKYSPTTKTDLPTTPGLLSIPLKDYS